MKHLIRSILTTIALALSSPALAAQQTVTLSVPDMYCSACPTIVKASLQAVEGVGKVEVSFDDRIAVVIFDDTTVSITDLINATTNAGYTSQITPQVENEADTEQPASRIWPYSPILG